VRSRRDATDGVVAGAVAGLFSGAPSTAHALLTGRELTASTRAVAGLIGLTRAAAPVQLAAGATMHAGLSIGWGVIGAFVLPRRGTVVVAALAGLGVGAVDLGIGRRRVPALRALPLAPQLADHVAFGAIAGAVIAARRLRRERAQAEVP
jgi:hypothetical protein